MDKAGLTVELKGARSVDETAGLLNKGVATIWRWIRDKKIIAVRFGDRTLIPESEIERLKSTEDEDNAESSKLSQD